jgi:chitin synthase
MFQAEDRILCLKIYTYKEKDGTKKDETKKDSFKPFKLGYVPDAKVRVDAMKSLLDLLLQRKRWINGSWFALKYVASHLMYHLKDSKH